MLKYGSIFVLLCVFSAIVDAAILCGKDAVLMRNNTSNICIPSNSLSQEKAFPKCCPLNYAYDKKARFCFASKQPNRFNNHSLLRIGLRNCINKIVADYYYSTDVEVFEKAYGIRNFCVDEVYNSKEKEIVLRKCEEGNIEEECRVGGARCLRKCCPDHEIRINGFCKATTNVTFNYTNWIDSVHVLKGNFGIIHGSTCKKYAATPDIDYKVDEWGNLHLREKGVLKEYKPYEEMYCVEHVQHEKLHLNGDKVLLCVLPPTQKFLYTRVIMVISCVFIALTIIVYLWLHEKRNLFSKTLITYCVSLFLMYTNLAYVQFNKNIPTAACTGIAYSVTFFAVSTFVWMNVMCIDIWLTFGLPNNLLTVSQKQKERKRFIWYSLYGWGFPAIVVLFTFFAKEYDFLPRSFRPSLGELKCLLVSDAGNYYKLVFYVIPITVLKAADVILFVLTIMHCMKIKNAINEMRDSRSCDKKRWFIADKERLILLFKLFVVMGVSWLSEALTSMIRFDNHPVLSDIETVFDVCNCLQGVLIFLIFACKREIFHTFKKKVFTQKLRRTSLSSGITQSSTLINKSFNRLNNIK